MADPTERLLQDVARKLVRTARTNMTRHADTAGLRKYCVVSTPRTGSTAFCEVLADTGLGWPLEWFNARYLDVVSAAAGGGSIDIRQYLGLVLFGSANFETGVFGLNLHVGQYKAMLQHGVDVFELGFDRIYYLSRRKKLAQAYSYGKALKTDLWSREAELAAGAAAVPVPMGARELCERLLQILSDDAFARERLGGRFDTVFVFEDEIGDGFAGATRRVAQDLGFDPAPSPAPLRRVRQSGAADRQALARLAEELGVTL